MKPTTFDMDQKDRRRRVISRGLKLFECVLLSVLRPSNNPRRLVCLNGFSTNVFIAAAPTKITQNSPSFVSQLLTPNQLIVGKPQG